MEQVTGRPAPPSARTADDDQAVEVPGLTAYIDLAEWDARAKTLGASSNSLAAGVACRLAVRVGRVHDDGTVTLRFPVTLRTEDDTRGNALTIVDVHLPEVRRRAGRVDCDVDTRERIAPGIVFGP